MMVGINDLKIVVGIASSSQVLLLREVMTLSTSPSVTGANLVSFGASVCLVVNGGMSLNLFLICKILS